MCLLLMKTYSVFKKPVGFPVKRCVPSCEGSWLVRDQESEHKQHSRLSLIARRDVRRIHTIQRVWSTDETILTQKTHLLQ